MGAPRNPPWEPTVSIPLCNYSLQKMDSTQQSVEKVSQSFFLIPHAQDTLASHDETLLQCFFLLLMLVMSCHLSCLSFSQVVQILQKLFVVIMLLLK